MPTVSPSQSNAGDLITAAAINNPINQLASVINGNIDSTNIADSGVTSTKIAANLPTSKLQNPYKFGVFRNAAWTATGGATKVPFDTKEFDTGTNFDIVTNYRFTAPAAGFYHFDAAAGYIPTASGDPVYLMIFKNGNEIKRGNQFPGFTSQQNIGVISTSVQLAANDYVEVFLWNASGSSKSGVPGANFCYFSGFLISTT